MAYVIGINNSGNSSDNEEIIEKLFTKCRPRNPTIKQPTLGNSPKRSSRNTSHFSESSDDESDKHIMDEPMDTDISTEPPSPPSSPAKVSEIARVIGNVPIAKYEGSPRRYGPKPPGYIQRVINSEDLSTGIAHSTKNVSNTLTDISCDELVKSILSIPLPLEDSQDSPTENSSRSSIQNCTQMIKQDGDCDTQTPKEHSLLKNKTNSAADLKEYEIEVSDLDCNSYISKRFNVHSSCVTSPEGVGSGQSVSPTKGNLDPMLSHANELILLHERVHQHILHEMVSVTDRSSFSTCPQTENETDGLGEQAVDGTRNFTLSPETTDCDSNEIESEFSLESSLHSGSRMNHMPILEDGLSSGVPSSDNEMEEDSDNEAPLTLEFMRKQINEIEEEIRAKLSSKDKLKDKEINPPNGLRELNLNEQENDIHCNSSQQSHIFKETHLTYLESSGKNNSRIIISKAYSIFSFYSLQRMC